MLWENKSVAQSVAEETNSPLKDKRRFIAIVKTKEDMDVSKNTGTPKMDGL